MSEKSIKPHKNKSIFGKLVGGATLLAAGSFYLYRQARPVRNAALPPALAGEQITFELGDSGSVNVYTNGDGDERPLLLLHSINAAANSFELKPLYDHFAQERPVYALDFPGFGLSERRSDVAYLPQLYADAIIHFLETLDQPADLVALSLGCEFAARAAQERPDLVNSVALLSPTGLRSEPVEVPEDKLYNFFSFPLWSQPFYNLLSTRASIKLFLGRNFVGDVPESFISYAITTADQPNSRFAPLYFLSGKLFTPEIRTAVYEKLTVPTLVIYDEDPNTTFEALPDLLAKNELWRATRVAPSKGLPHWDMLEGTVSALSKFWSTIPQKVS